MDVSGSLPDRLRRRIRAAGAAAALVAVAGCSALPSLGGSTSSGGPASDGQDAGRDRGPAGPGGECDEERILELNDELNEVSLTVGERRLAYEDVRHVPAGLDLLIDQLENGFPERVRERARAVGLAARESVVLLEMYDGDRAIGQATAWSVSDEHLVTNAHNVEMRGEKATRLEGFTVDGDRFDADVVEYVPSLSPDVAVLRTAYSAVPPLPVGTDATLAQGDPLVQVGHPGGFGYWAITLGRFYRHDEFLTEDGSVTDLRTLVPGLEGVSGSPLLDLDGEVVGLTYGAVPAINRDPGDPPVAAPAVVYDRPIASIGISTHLGADSVMEYYRRWTS